MNPMRLRQRRKGIFAEWGMKEVLIAIGVIMLIGIGVLVAQRLLTGSSPWLENLTNSVINALPIPGLKS